MTICVCISGRLFSLKELDGLKTRERSNKGFLPKFPLVAHSLVLRGNLLVTATILSQIMATPQKPITAFFLVFPSKSCSKRSLVLKSKHRIQCVKIGYSASTLNIFSELLFSGLQRKKETLETPALLSPTLVSTFQQPAPSRQISERDFHFRAT